jgi:hypothetical protein
MATPYSTVDATATSFKNLATAIGERLRLLASQSPGRDGLNAKPTAWLTELDTMLTNVDAVRTRITTIRNELVARLG